MNQKPPIRHAGCGALVTKTGVEANGLPILICGRGHRLVDAGELAPRGSVFTPPDRRSAFAGRVDTVQA